MPKNSITVISQNSMDQIVGGKNLVVMLAAGAGAVVTMGVVIGSWITYGIMAKSRAKVEEQLNKERDNTNAFCTYAKQIHEQCLALRNKPKSEFKSEL